MTFGTMKKIKKHYRIISLLLTLNFVAPVYALELSELLHSFNQQQKSTVDFSEEKHAFYFDEPLKSSGYLQFIAPNKLYKFILKPEKISQKIQGDELHIKNGTDIRTINLNTYPEFSIIFRALVSFLSGDHAALKKNFKINFENNPASWVLLLSPHDSYIASHVESIKLSGSENKLNKIIITEPNKDKSITHIYNHR